MFYTVKTPWLLKKFYPSLIWEVPTKDKILYLTFDDGPHPTATPFVLDELKKYNAKATFFCIGKNVMERNEIYQRILGDGHKTGNHTFNHLNGWKTNNETYFENIFEAAKYIDSNLFRPPYGRITKSQISIFKSRIPNFKIIMWSLLSGDFDENISPEHCLQNVITNAQPGNIIVFHDSSKAWKKMSFALPKTLKHFSVRGYQFMTL
jgi:peptidoglycan-N-acetylglucosamine deacetylase